MKLNSLSVQLPGEDDGCREPGLAERVGAAEMRGDTAPATDCPGSRRLQRNSVAKTARDGAGRQLQAAVARLSWPGPAF